ncbi:SRPBCC family protein [Bosea sp. (in: a-proteobacteria)]|uniref:SRPBCC family protein n=1 Tax=Bosea sp. (in: a-proteobacteria) TaxID=1871050 RepID=UPI002FCBCBEB
MTERSVIHATVTVERVFRASPARVFAAWSSAEALSRWMSPVEDWQASYDHFDFRIGGGDRLRFGPPEGEAYVTESRFLDIVPDVRIISAGSMSTAGTRVTAGVLTVEFKAAASGCRMTLTEQTAFLDGHERPEDHEAGWQEILNKLAVELAREQQAA